MTIIASMLQSIRKAASYNRHELAPQVIVVYYADAKDALLKAISE